MPEKAVVPMGKSSKIITVVVLIGVAIMMVVLAIICFTGNIKMQYGDTSFTIEASYYNDLTVDYTAVDSIEYRESCDSGSRTNGFG